MYLIFLTASHDVKVEIDVAAVDANQSVEKNNFTWKNTLLLNNIADSLIQPIKSYKAVISRWLGGTVYITYNGKEILFTFRTVKKYS